MLNVNRIWIFRFCIVLIGSFLSACNSDGENSAPRSAIKAPDISLSVDGVDFGNINVGSISDVSRVTITNSGDTPLNITEISVSDGFIEDNNCNNFLSAGSSCQLSLSFVPTVAQRVTGTLVIDGDAVNMPYTVNLTGIAEGSTNKPAYLFQQEFENYSAPVIYTPADVTRDFNINLSGDQYSWRQFPDGQQSIVADPDVSGTRGNVLRKTHRAGKLGNAEGMFWMHRLNPVAKNVNYPSKNERSEPTDIKPNSNSSIWDYTGGPPDLAAFINRQDQRDAAGDMAYDELYFSYDVYLSANYFMPFSEKLPGIAAGTNLQASHGPVAFPGGLYGINAQFNLQNNEAWPGIPDGEGALAFYNYDADRAQDNMFLAKNGVLEDRRGYYTGNTGNSVKVNGFANAYLMPRETWITIELRLKLNDTTNTSIPSIDSTVIESQYNRSSRFAGDGNKRNGLVEVWITDPRPVSSGGTDGRSLKMLSYTTEYRWWKYLQIDKIKIRSTFNVNHNLPPEDTFIYYDNFRASTSRITGK